MIRTLRLVLAATAALAAIEAPALALDDLQAAAAIDQAVQKAIADGISPGFQVAVYKNGSPLLVKGYGSADLEMKVPVSNDSIFRIGSLTKQFTAVALLQLQEAGKLSVDDSLAKYYPDYPRAGDITIRQMLNHTSGLSNYTSQKGYGERDAMIRRSTEEYVDYFSRMAKTQDFEPGTSYTYSNTAYYILGAIIEKLEGKPLGVVFQERFFGPLGMTRTAVDDESDIVVGRAEGYDADGPGKFRNAAYLSMTAPGGGGSMRSTASDLVRWNSALFGGKLLKPASFAAMIAPGKLNNGANSGTVIPVPPGAPKIEYGFGLRTATVAGHPKVAHSGGIPGFNSQLAEYPQDRVTVAVLANTIGKDVGAGTVLDAVERIVLDLPAKP